MAIPLPPPRKKPKAKTPSNTIPLPASKGGSTPSKGSSDTKGSSSSGSGGKYAGMSKAQRTAYSREDSQRKAAGNTFLQQARNLEMQAVALEEAIKNSFSAARKQNLRDVDRALSATLSALRSGANAKYAEFMVGADNTEKARAYNEETNASNLVRERQESLAQALAQGAGETDQMRTMLLAARRWSENAGQANRAYFDSMASTNAAITDLREDVRTGLTNTFIQSENERDRIWQVYYDGQAEALTQLGNIRGQQRDYYAQAEEMGAEPKKGAKKKAKLQSQKAFNRMAKMKGESYKQKAVPGGLRNFDPGEAVEASTQSTLLQSAPDLGPMNRAEGASLRKWES